LVRLEATVDKNGSVKDVKVLEGYPELGAAAIRAISKWRFRPANRDGHSVEEQTRVNVVFRLEPKQVHALVVWPDAASSTR